MSSSYQGPGSDGLLATDTAHIAPASLAAPQPLLTLQASPTRSNHPMPCAPAPSLSAQKHSDGDHSGGRSLCFCGTPPTVFQGTASRCAPAPVPMKRDGKGCFSREHMRQLSRGRTGITAPLQLRQVTPNLANKPLRRRNLSADSRSSRWRKSSCCNQSSPRPESSLPPATPAAVAAKLCSHPTGQLHSPISRSSSSLGHKRLHFTQACSAHRLRAWGPLLCQCTARQVAPGYLPSSADTWPGPGATNGRTAPAKCSGAPLRCQVAGDEFCRAGASGSTAARAAVRLLCFCCKGVGCCCPAAVRVAAPAAKSGCEPR